MRNSSSTLSTHVPAHSPDHPVSDRREGARRARPAATRAGNSRRTHPRSFRGQPHFCRRPPRAEPRRRRTDHRAAPRVRHPRRTSSSSTSAHQGYVHKLLTGRRERFDTMRQYEGLNGFLLRTESEHDCYGAGHAGTALTAALGMAVARDLRGADEHVVCVAGDAAFTCGVTFEALNNVAEQTKRFIVVLNDNEWSIAKNVGAIASYFNRIATHPTYAHLHEKAAQFVEKIGGKFATDLAHKVEAGVKNLLASQRHLRGPRPALLRPDRRPRHRRCSSTPSSSSRRRTSPSSCTSSRKRAAATRPRSSSRTSSTASASSSRRPARPPHDVADLLANFSARRSRTSPTAITRSSPSPAPCPAAPGSSILQRRIPTATSTSASPRSTPRSSPRPRHPGLQALPRDLLAPSCSAPMT